MASFFWQITVTDMRRNPTYAIYYNNWARLFILGIIPAAMLIYLNYKVCMQFFVYSILSTNEHKYNKVIGFHFDTIETSGNASYFHLFPNHYIQYNLLISYSCVVLIGALFCITIICIRILNSICFLFLKKSSKKCVIYSKYM